ncbi:TetR/AcrR family transcriptional regulator [Kolteria novifilia]
MTTPKRGRPKSEAKRRQILEAARTVLFDVGYSAMTMETVAELAGVSKPTIYSHFDSKEKLFGAVLQTGADERLRELSAISTNAEEAPEEALRRFGNQFLNLALSKEARAWDRIMIAEIGRHPAVANLFFQAGPSKVLALLGSYLREQDDAGRLRVPDPAIAAEQFIGLLLGIKLLRHRVGLDDDTNRGEWPRHVDEAVRTFLAAYRPKTADSA